MKVLRLSKTTAPSRSIVYNAYSGSGAILQKPVQTRLGLVKAMCVVVPFLMLGAHFSKMGAAFLEDTDIFVVDEDEDDD